MQSIFRPFFGIFFQALKDRLLNQGIDVLKYLGGIRRRCGLMLDQKLRQGFELDRLLAGEDLVQKEPERIDVALLRDALDRKSVV